MPPRAPPMRNRCRGCVAPSAGRAPERRGGSSRTRAPAARASSLLLPWLVKIAQRSRRYAPPMPSISACLVVHDEEKLIERCLASLDGVVDEIVLVHDGPCTDRTLDIARGYGARVFERPRHGEAER